MMAAGASRLLDPIHGRGVFQRSNISSNLKGSMHRMVAAGASRLLEPIHGRGVLQRSNIISNLKESMRRMVTAEGIIKR
jgi:hypothetical protein